MTIDKALQNLDGKKTATLFSELYGSGESVLTGQKKRYAALIEQFKKRFGDDEIRIFSCPGRSEIGGNHTDHNHGKVLAASIQKDCIAVISKTTDNSISIYDESYHEDYRIDLKGGLAPVQNEKGSIALVRGIAAGFGKNGFAAGGFKACVSSQVLSGSGVSSSAAFEMLICGILNRLYNDGKIPVEQLARIGQYAENNYWGKNSGLLDQMACAFGGMVAMDFNNPAAPVVKRIPFDFAAQNFRLILVDTGGSHANLSEAYSAIPGEMKSVASFFGKEVLRDIPLEDIIKNLPALRAQYGDRAVLRALHFAEENSRVDAEVKALEENDFPAFLRLVNESGNSSYKLLQNVALPGTNPAAPMSEQKIPVCLALTEIFFHMHNIEGACRVHGGGFAGVIQVFIPAAQVDGYTAWMLQGLGVPTDAAAEGPVFVMSVRHQGFLEIEPA
ncbi:galactokinase [Spirochaetia bacterium]|nr:galactokinase [Spirochaetia bacterium]